MAEQPLYVITGVANEASIAWAVAHRLLTRGAACVLAVLPRNLRRAEKLLERTGLNAEVIAVDVKDDASIESLREALVRRGQRIQGLLHAIAYADLEEFERSTSDTSRAGFRTAMDVSVYSLLALCGSLRPMLRGGSIVSLSYYGSQRCVPGYSLMGIAKAALESACRYLAHDLGREGIRVNCVAPGALVTMSTAAFSDIDDIIAQGATASPIPAPTQLNDVACVVSFMLSEESRGITGQMIPVDNGLSIMGPARFG